MVPLAEILRDLDALVSLEPQDEAGMARWRHAVSQFRERHPMSAEVLPHVVEHYLADADIRVGDARYRESQLLELARAVDPLRVRGPASSS